MEEKNQDNLSQQQLEQEQLNPDKSSESSAIQKIRILLFYYTFIPQIFISRPCYRSELKIFLCLFSVSSLIGVAGISSTYPSMTATAQDSEAVVRFASPPEAGTPRKRAQNPQPDPQEDRFGQQPTPVPSPVPPEPEAPLSEPRRMQSPVPKSDEVTIQVENIEVTGSTVFSKAELNPIIQPLEGRVVTREELREVADAITQMYLEKGFLTSSAVLVEESLPTGVVEIRVIEGELEKINIEGTQRLNPSYVRSRVELGAGTPLNIAKLEDQLRLLRANPLFDNVEASLKAGSEENKSILVVRVTEADPFQGNFGIDNYSPPSVGGERIILNLLYRNLTGIGDEISTSYRPRIETIDGTYRLELRYQAPLNPMDGTLQLRTLIDRNKVIQEPFEEFDIRGESERYEISYRQPLIRTPREELALSLGFTYYTGQTFAFGSPEPFSEGPNEDGVSRTSVFEFGQDYTLRDVSGAWAFRSQFRFGTGLFDATENPSPIPDGQFFSWLAQVQRVQVLNDDNFLIIQGDLQLTPNPLLPSEQFVIGGGQSVRGYRQNVRAGDNGLRFSIEDRITVVRNEGGESVFIVAPFFDLGYVWNVGDNPNIQFSQRFIAGMGLGFLWEPIKGLNLRLDYAPPLIDLDDRGNNVQDDGFNFSVNYQF